MATDQTTTVDGDVSDEYATIKQFISDLKDDGVTPDKVVVPGDDWEAIKRHAEEAERDSGLTGTYIDGVLITYKSIYSEPRAVIKYPGDYE